MYAVISTGGKQYRVAPGDLLQIEKLDAEPGTAIVFDEVLLIADGDDVAIGNPRLEGAKVNAEVVSQLRGEKIRIVKFRRRKHYMRHQGHRQYLTEVRITSIDK